MADAGSAARRVAEDLFGPPAERTFEIRYWDGVVERPPNASAFALDVRTPSAFRRMLLPPTELKIVEAYLFGDIDIVGDIEASAVLGDVVAQRIGTAGAAWRLLQHLRALPSHDEHDDDDDEHGGVHVARRLFRLGRMHSKARDAHVVRFHYDVGNDFYSLWLDRQMVYSCAYFARGDETLDEAQTAKLDLVCRKLRLMPGERLLDIGCGWGALVIHAAKAYGVRATGITLSEQQAAFARARVEAEGLGDRVTIAIRDYRALGDQTFDKISSVGMVEHVGLARLPAYFAAAYRALASGGLFLNHGIISLADARPRPLFDPILRRLWQRDQFIRRYVFPDGDLVPSTAVIGVAEHEAFELRDVESLREHYVTTLRHWVHRLEAHADEARAIVGDVTYRVWRLYMAASAHGFQIGRIGIIQSLFAKPDAAGIAHVPRTRDDIYAHRAAPAGRLAD